MLLLLLLLLFISIFDYQGVHFGEGFMFMVAFYIMLHKRAAGSR